MGMWLLPVAAFSLAGLTFITSYFISQSKGLVKTPLPFISDTGTLPPASCWFGFLLNATAYTFLLVVLVRYLQVQEQLGQDSTTCKWVNKVALVVGIVGSIGISMVACFQETNAKTLHLTGALLAFGGATIYGFMHCYITHELISKTAYSHTWILAIRFVISLVCSVALVLVFVALKKAGYTLPPYYGDREPYEDKTWYYTATISEWALAISFFVYILTFGYEFSTVKIEAVLTTIPNRVYQPPKELVHAEL